MILITFTRAYPWQSVLMVGALLLAGLAEGSSLSVLLPILSIAVDADAASQSEFARIVTDLLERVGITPVISNLLVVAVLGVVLKSMLLLVAERQVGFLQHEQPEQDGRQAARADPGQEGDRRVQKRRGCSLRCSTSRGRRSAGRGGDAVNLKIDGIKIHLDSNEWVHILPNPDRPHFAVTAEADSLERAAELAARFRSEIEEYINAE